MDKGVGSRVWGVGSRKAVFRDREGWGQGFVCSWAPNDEAAHFFCS